MKSPIYGMGRNRKHKSIGAPLHAAAANVNMHGKKEKVMSCGCCFCIDFRDKLKDEEHRKEINTYMKGEET